MTKLLVELGHPCYQYQCENLVQIDAQRVQCDQIWSFVGCKQKNLPVEERGELGRGDVWTWTPIDADTKLMISWLVGHRDPHTAYDFMLDLPYRLKNRVQLTTDGLKCCLNAVKGAFGNDINYAMLVKTYGPDPQGEKRYCPAVVLTCEQVPKIGNPDMEQVATSFVERSNLPSVWECDGSHD